MWDALSGEIGACVAFLHRSLKGYVISVHFGNYLINLNVYIPVPGLEAKTADVIQFVVFYKYKLVYFVFHYKFTWHRM